MRTKTVAAVVLALALFGACSSGDDDDTTADESTTTTEAIDLSTLLLTPEDIATGDALDAGWITGDVSAGVEIDLPECLLEVPTGTADTAEVKLVTNNDLKLPSLEQDLSVYEGDGATEAFTAAATRLDECVADFVFQGTPSAGTIERLPLTLGGDQSAAWRTTVNIATVDVAITNIHVQVDDHELSFVHVDTGSPEATVLEGYVTKALAKLG